MTSLKLIAVRTFRFLLCTFQGFCQWWNLRHKVWVHTSAYNCDAGAKEGIWDKICKLKFWSQCCRLRWGPSKHGISLCVCAGKTATRGSVNNSKVSKTSFEQGAAGTWLGYLPTKTSNHCWWYDPGTLGSHTCTEAPPFSHLVPSAVSTVRLRHFLIRTSIQKHTKSSHFTLRDCTLCV